MVSPFQFARIPKIIFKNGVIAELPAIVKSFGSRIVLVTGKSSFVRSVYAEKMLYGFDNMGISSKLIIVSGEPSPELIDESVSMLNKERFDLVVGIGGGSVLDAGKAISGMIYRSESVTDFLEEQVVRQQKML
jgi:alcohol dehydrogenase